MQVESAAAWLQFVPLRHEVSPTLLAFSEKVANFLRKCKCIPVEGPIPSKIDVLVCPPAFAHLFDSSWLRGATGCAPIASFVDLERDRAVLKFLGCNMDVGLALQRCLAFELKLQHCSPSWFAELFSYLAEQSAPAGFPTNLRIFPLRNGERYSQAQGPVFVLYDGLTALPEPPAYVPVLHSEAAPRPTRHAVGALFECLTVQPALPEVVIRDMLLPRYKPNHIDSLTKEASVEDLLYLHKVLCKHAGPQLYLPNLRGV